MAALRINISRRRLGGAGLVASIAAIGALLMTPVTTSAGWASPGNLPNTGRIWSLAVDPSNPSHLLMGTDQGVFRSGDAGSSWQSTSVHVRTWVVGFDIRTGNEEYAGTAGDGVYSSTNGGQSWTATTGLSSLNVRSLAFSLSGVAAGTDNGVDLTTDGSHWGAIGLGGVSVDAITVVANSPSLILMATTDSGNVAQGSVFVSSGHSWSALGTNVGLRTQAFSSSISSGPPTQANPHRALIVTMSASSSNGGSQTSTYPATFRSLDGGNNWDASQGIPQLGGVQPIGLTTTAFSPLDPDLVYAGADAGGSTGGDLVRSTDGGLDFSEFVTGLPADARNVSTIAVAATTPPTLYIGINSDKSGPRVYKTTDTDAPAPPALLAEAPGAPIPSAAAQITSLATPKPSPSAGNSNKPATGVVKLLGTLFGWPVPLLFEILFAIGIAYTVVWWRQRSYIEGPPD
jgi:hypothetical protein